MPVKIMSGKIINIDYKQIIWFIENSSICRLALFLRMFTADNICCTRKKAKAENRWGKTILKLQNLKKGSKET